MRALSAALLTKWKALIAAKTVQQVQLGHRARDVIGDIVTPILAKPKRQRTWTWWLAEAPEGETCTEHVHLGSLCGVMGKAFMSSSAGKGQGQGLAL
ncbi:unnamed protein product [Symbiodinium sp. KB8]|nr:unnamed protein product [Symbiodinium sp. KB8]